MSVTLDTLHALRGWSNAVASKNMRCMSITLDTSHALRGWLKELADWNMLCATPAHAHGLWPLH